MSSQPAKFSRQFADGPGWSALAARDDLVPFGESNALALFVAELRFGIEDIATFAADALTDHGNDKKCDLVAVLRDSGQLVVAQAYVAKDPSKKSEGPAGKASDLNTAVSWLLSGELKGLPDVLRDAAIEARDAISAGDISEFQIWSVHNCPEGVNVKNELKQAAKTGSHLIKTLFADAQINVTFSEVGRDAVNEAYRRTQLPILVDEKIKLATAGGFEVEGESWKAYSTAVKGSELRELWQKHKTDLMSPNIRDYLGVVKSERNINNGIKTTAQDSPRDFMIYNNGITAMVHEYEPSKDGKSLTVSGIGIVNGGQTTGSLGTLSDEEAKGLDKAWVQIRFVASTEPEVMGNVVRYNNTQNKVEATDFRSKDHVQDRLRKEFEKVPDAIYRGGRRGSANDAIKRDRALLPDGSVAQSLASFHGSPNLAYNELRQIWENDNTYSKVFNDNTNARHIVFCYSLLKAVEAAKLRISNIEEGKRTTPQKTHAEFFRSRGGVHLLVAAIGSSIETILGEAVADRFSLQFKKNVSPTEGVKLWAPVVQTGLAFSGQLSSATNLGLKTPEKVDAALQLFGAMIEATRESSSTIFDSFAKHVDLGA